MAILVAAVWLIGHDSSQTALATRARGVAILDTFNRPNGPIGARWRTCCGAKARFLIWSNSITTGGRSAGGYWKVASFGRGEVVGLTVSALPASDGATTSLLVRGVRSSRRTFGGYECRWTYRPAAPDVYEILRVTRGAVTRLASAKGHELAAGQHLGCEVVGDRITAAYSNTLGRAWTVAVRAKDRAYSRGGSLGLRVSGPTFHARYDDFSGGTVTCTKATCGFRSLGSLPYTRGRGRNPPPTPSWSPEVPLTRSGTGVYSAIAASGDTLHFAYLDQNARTLYYKRSTDQEASWSAPVVVGSADVLSLTEPLASIGTTLHIVYQRGDGLYYKRSTDNGGTWSAETMLDAQPSGRYYRVSIDAAGANVYAVWASHSNTNFTSNGLYFRRSTNGGATWNGRQQLAQGADDPGRPALSGVAGAVHLVWTDARDRNPPCYTFPACPEIYYRRSVDGGASWSEPRRMTFGKGATEGRPEVVALANGSVSLVWQDDMHMPGEEELFSTQSRDKGVTWRNNQRVTFARKESTHAFTWAHGSTVLLCWFDRRDLHDAEIYTKFSNDEGATWGPEQRLTDNGVDDFTQGIVATSAFAHVVWVRGDQMYYSRRPLGR